MGIYCFEISNGYEKMSQVLSCSIDSSVRLLLQSLLSNSCRGQDSFPLLCAREYVPVLAKSRSLLFQVERSFAENLPEGNKELQAHLILAMCARKASDMQLA